MTSYVPPTKNGASGWIGYVSLAPKSPTGQFQANPTLASGDVKIAIDDGAPANLGTLPVVDADFTKRVKIVLSQAETNGDNLSILFSDAAGDEWSDLFIPLQTVVRQIDDVADLIIDLDTGLRGVIALQDTGAVQRAVWAGDTGLRGIIAALDTGLRDYITNVDTGITNRLNLLAFDLDTGLPADIADLDTGIRDLIAALDTGLRGILVTNGVTVGSLADTGLVERLTAIEGQTNKLIFDTGNKVHAAIYKVKGIGIIGSGDTGGGDPFRPVT